MTAVTAAAAGAVATRAAARIEDSSNRDTLAAEAAVAGIVGVLLFMRSRKPRQNDKP